MEFSSRLGKLAPYPFVEISRIIAEKRAAGADVVTFGIGDPDIPTPQPIIDRLLTASEQFKRYKMYLPIIHLTLKLEKLLLKLKIQRQAR